MSIHNLKIQKLNHDREVLRRIDKDLRRLIKDPEFLFKWNDVMTAALNENHARYAEAFRAGLVEMTIQFEDHGAGGAK